MKRMTFFVYGVTGHLLFLATYACLAGFVGMVRGLIQTARFASSFTI
ncbi:MAG: hypothetical protein ACM3U2_00675 [Deltaproteobacteria bacterium]